MSPFVSQPVAGSGPIHPLTVEVGRPYAIVGPDGTRASFNDRDDADFVGFLNGEDGITGLERAGVRESADDLPDADGGVHGAFRYSRLTFTLKGLVSHEPLGALAGWTEAQVRAERISRLMRATDAMRADSLLLWTPSSAPPVRVAFRQQQPTRITGRRPKAFLIAGVSETAAIEAQDTDTLLIPIAETDQQLGTYGGTATAVNNGAAEAWPVITIPAGLVNPIITNHRYGRSLVLFSVLGLAAGTETFVIDTDPRRRTITVNGVPKYSALYWPGSNWFPLGPGDNVLEVTAEAGNVLNVTVEWRQAWG